MTASARRLALALALAGCAAAVALAARALAETPVACPEGTSLARARPPAGPEQWCERAGPGLPVRHGLYRAFYPDGRIKIEGLFADGTRTGRWTYWHGNGIGPGRGQKKEEGEYRAGREQGRWTRWHSLGPRREEGEYRDGARQGRWTFWSELGEKVHEGDYRDGREAGVWLSWSPSGAACPSEDRGEPVPPSDDRAGVSA